MHVATIREWLLYFVHALRAAAVQRWYAAIIQVRFSTVSMGCTARWRSLFDLHHRGPQARGGVISIETEPRHVTDLYNACMGHVRELVGVC